MGQKTEKNWMVNRISDTAEKACTKSVSLLKAKNASGFEDAVPEIRDSFKKVRAVLLLARDDYKNF